MNGQNRGSLLQYITEISFAVYDTLLYLDTHPEDQQALAYYQDMDQKRREALAEYGKQYGPLTADCPAAASCGRWQWIYEPWPWEGGAC